MLWWRRTRTYGLSKHSPGRYPPLRAGVMSGCESEAASADSVSHTLFPFRTRSGRYDSSMAAPPTSRSLMNSNRTFCGCAADAESADDRFEVREPCVWAVCAWGWESLFGCGDRRRRVSPRGANESGGQRPGIVRRWTKPRWSKIPMPAAAEGFDDLDRFFL